MKTKIIKFIIIFLVICISSFLLIWLLTNKKYHIKTEYGDSFTISDNRFLEDIFLVSDDNSKFFTSIYHFENENNFISLRDTQYFRCYQIKNDTENVYICKIKSHNSNLFFVLNDDDKNMMLTNIQTDHERFFADFLCDDLYMSILLPYLDNLYHSEVLKIALKLTSNDYEGLEQYGLTQEMINDKDSLDEKIRIMEDYLKNNKE